MASQSKHIVFGPQITSMLLHHVDEHGGKEGLYIQDKNKAIEEATEAVNKLKPPSHPKITQTQVYNKLNSLASQVNIPSDSNLQTFLLRGTASLSKNYLNNLGRSQGSVDRQSNVDFAVPMPAAQVNPTIVDLTHSERSTTSQEVPSVTLSGKPLERSQEIVQYLAKGAHCFVDDDDALFKLQAGIMQAITAASSSLMQTDPGPKNSQMTLAGAHRLPMMNEALYVNDFCSICQRMFGINAVNGVPDIIGQDNITKEQLLRALIAAFMSERVFLQGTTIEQKLVGMLKASTEITQIRDDLLARVCPLLSEHILREGKQILLQQKFQPSNDALHLVNAFNRLVAIFLDNNGLRRVGDRWEEWMHKLEAVFAAAIKLKASVICRDKGEHFWWSSYKALFDPSLLKTDDHVSTGDRRHVKLCFFPMLKNPDGEAVLRGIVALKPKK